MFNSSNNKLSRNGFYLLIIILFGISTVVSGCKLKIKQSKNNGKTVAASGVMQDTIIKSTYFSGVEIGGVTEVEIAQDSLLTEPIIEVSGDKNFIKNLELEVTDEVLKVDIKEDIKADLDDLKLKLKIKMNVIKYLEVSGAASMKTTQQIKCDNLELNLSGVGEMNIDCNANEVVSDVSGTGKLEVKGIANRHTSQISGVGGIDAFNLITKSTDVKVSGTGGAEVSASDSLRASVSGIGSVKYKGGAKIVSTDISGMGDIEAE